MVDEIGLLGRVVTNVLSFGSQYMINGYQAGYPVNATYGFQYAGVWKSQAEIDQDKSDKRYVSTTYAPGRQRYIDQNRGLLHDNDISFRKGDPDVTDDGETFVIKSFRSHLL